MNAPKRELHHFLLLTHEEQTQAIKSMSADGWGDNTIAVATGLSVEMVRQAIGERRERVTA